MVNEEDISKIKHCLTLTLTAYALDRPCFTFDVDRGFSVLHLMDFLQKYSQGLDLLYCRSIF